MNSRALVLLADLLAGRFGLRPLLQRWMAETPIAHDTTDGEGAFDEQHLNFGVGTYSAGAAAKKCQAIEDADRVIRVGTCFVDTLTAGFTQQFAGGTHVETSLAAQSAKTSVQPLPMAQVVPSAARTAPRMRFCAAADVRSAGQPVY